MKTTLHYISALLLFCITHSSYAQMPSFRENKPDYFENNNKGLLLIKIEKEEYKKIVDSLKKTNKFIGENEKISNKPEIKQGSNLYEFTKEEADTEFVKMIREKGTNVTYFQSKILYTYHKEEAEEIKNEINTKYKESRESDNRNDIIKLTKISEKIDSLSKELLIHETYLKENTITKFRWIFPSWYNSNPHKKEAFFQMLYNKEENSDFYFVNNAALQLNSAGATVQSEITSAYLQPLRISLGTLVSNSKEDTEDTDTEEATENTEAFQRLINGGGNIYMNVELPFVYRGNDYITFYGSLYAKGAIEIAEFSNDVDTSTGNGSLGTNWYLSASTDNKEFIFYSTFNWGLYAGSDAFLNRLQVQKNYFGFGQLTFGVTILDRLRLSVMTNTFGVSELQSGKVVFGAQILSGLFDKKK